MPVQVWNVLLIWFSIKLLFVAPTDRLCREEHLQMFVVLLEGFWIAKLVLIPLWQTLVSSVTIPKQIAWLTLLLEFFGVPLLGLQPSLSMGQHSQPAQSHPSGTEPLLAATACHRSGQHLQIRVHILVCKTTRYWKLSTSEKAIFKSAISLMCLHVHLSGVRVVPVQICSPGLCQVFWRKLNHSFNSPGWGWNTERLDSSFVVITML